MRRGFRRLGARRSEVCLDVTMLRSFEMVCDVRVFPPMRWERVGYAATEALTRSATVRPQEAVQRMC